MAANLPIASREYKLTLAAARFEDRAAACGELLQRVREIVAGVGGTPVEQAELSDKTEKKRRTWFLDTPAKAFREAGFFLRVRREKKTEYTLTLKRRSPDRYLSASADVTCRIVGAKEKPKFEEDILPPFVSKFSRSNSAEELAEEPSLRTVGEAAALFSSLGGLGVATDEPVRVGGIQAFEIVQLMGGFRFDPGVDVKMSTTFWYDSEAMEGVPLVAELSYDYDAPEKKALEEDPIRLEGFPIATVRGAFEVFRLLQGEAEWIDPTGSTKSDFAGGI
ncbi:MAG: hypothetical protein ACJ8GN_08625 [Longimicrobiaceae bacterium]